VFQAREDLLAEDTNLHAGERSTEAKVLTDAER
jgi:hypothetical protein